MNQRDTVIFRYVVPKHRRKEVLESAHDCVLSGHLGIERTLESLNKRYYWPNMQDHATSHVRECQVCQAIKPPQEYSRSLLTPLRPTKPFELVTMDIIGELKASNSGNKYITIYTALIFFILF